jgi:hypothetical protein
MAVTRSKRVISSSAFKKVKAQWPVESPSKSPKHGSGIFWCMCCRVGSLLTFDIPQTALVATLDTYDFLGIIFLYFALFALDSTHCL